MLLKENDIFREITNVTQWHKNGFTGKGISIVLLDGSGKARENMKSYYKDVLGRETEEGHATNVGFTVHEFAPDVKIYMFDFKRNKTEAIEWIAHNEDYIDLINVSLAGINGGKTPTFEPFEYIDIPLVCASGNDDFENRISYPARHDWTLAIGAVHYNHSTKNINIAGYSNKGVDLDAVSFSGIRMMRDNGYKWSVYGTSFSSPAIVGTLACYLQWRKDNGLKKLSLEGMRHYIRSNTIDLYDTGFDNKSGYGLFKLPRQVPIINKPKPNPNPPNTYDLPKGYPQAKVVYEGKSVNGILINGQTMLQLRHIADLLGISIGYNASTKEVAFNGEKVNPVIIKGRSYMHIREVSNMLDLAVRWNNQTKTVVLSD